MLGTINMRTEFNAFFTHLTDTRQRKNLETTAIGQHRAVKSIELMQTTCLLNDIQSRTQIQMISVSQNNLRLNIIFNFMQMDTFNCS